MNIKRNVGCLIAIGCTAVAVGCGSAGEPAPSGTGAVPPAVAPTADSKEMSRPFYSIPIEEDHTVGFYETADGEYFVAEMGRTFQSPVMGKASRSKTLSGTFKAIRPESEVPAELLAADKAAAARPVPQHVELAPPSQGHPVAGAGPKLYTAADVQWFKNTMCNPVTPGGGSQFYERISIVECFDGYSYIGSGWVTGGEFHAQAQIGSEGQAAPLQLFRYPGTLTAQFTIPPGGWAWVGHLFDGNFYQYSAWLAGAGGNTTVAMAVEGCGEANQWSCVDECGSGQGCDPYNTVGCEIVGVNNNGVCYNF